MINLFQRRKKPQSVPPKRKATGEALRAVPRHSPTAEEKIDPETDKLYLRLPVAPRNPVSRALDRKGGLKRHRQFDLDPVGRAYWELCDGKRTLAQIADGLRRRYGWKTRESRDATLQYTITLTQRELIFLDLSHRAAAKEERGGLKPET